MIADLGTKFPRKPQYDYLKARVRIVELSCYFHNIRIARMCLSSQGYHYPCYCVVSGALPVLCYDSPPL